MGGQSAWPGLKVNKILHRPSWTGLLWGNAIEDAPVLKTIHGLKFWTQVNLADETAGFVTLTCKLEIEKLKPCDCQVGRHVKIGVSRDIAGEMQILMQNLIVDTSNP